VKKIWITAFVFAAITGFLYAGGASELPLVTHGDFVLQGTVLVQYQGIAENVIIPGNLGITEIADEAFISWDIKSVTIPEGVRKCGERSFMDCYSLETIRFPSTLTDFDVYGFGYISSFASFIVDERNPVFSSSSGVLFNKNKTALIKYPCAREGRSFAVPAGVERIEDEAFVYSEKLVALTLPNGVIFIGNSAFAGCRGLTAISIPPGLIFIGDYAFSGCAGLASITIPASVIYIGEGAFNYCNGLKSLTIPASVNVIGELAFTGCASLTNITVDSNNNEFSSAGGLLFDKTGTVLIYYPSGRQERTYTIPAGVKQIGNGAFYRCEALSGITIPSSVTTIGKWAFSGCDGLNSIVIPNGVASIGESAFSGCSSLIIVTIPSSVTSIGSEAFQWCRSLRSITIPSNVTDIGNYAFYGCENLTTATISRRTRIGEEAFPSGTQIRYSD
jgi:hypothetical protein